MAFLLEEQQAGIVLPVSEYMHLVYWANRNRGFSGEAFVEPGCLEFALHDRFPEVSPLGTDIVEESKSDRRKRVFLSAEIGKGIVVKRLKHKIFNRQFMTIEFSRRVDSIVCVYAKN